MKAVAAILVILMGIYMLYLGIPKSMQPPIVSGIAFIIIGGVFLLDKKGG